MSDVAQISIIRQPDTKAAISVRQNAVTMEPVTRPPVTGSAPSSAPAAPALSSVPAVNERSSSGPESASKSDPAFGDLSPLTPIERVFNHRWINFFGAFAAIPQERGPSDTPSDTKPNSKSDTKSDTKSNTGPTPTPAPVDAEAAFKALYENLRAAWSKRDARALEATASQYLKQQAVSGIPLIDPFTRTLYEFFKARGCEGTGAEILALIGNMTPQQINDQLVHDAQLVSKLKTQAFAAMINGTLSQQGIDLLFAIKSIAAFQLIAAAVLKYGNDPAKIPVKMICMALDADIVFPEWAFDVDPCRWPKGGKGAVTQNWSDKATAVDATAYATAVADSPLKQRIEREARMVEGRAAQAVQAEAAIQAGAWAGTGAGVVEGAVPANNGIAAPAKRTTGDKKVGDKETAKMSMNPPPKIRPYNCNCEEKPPAPCQPPDPCCVKINYYITDTLVLRDKVKRYVPSDLAYIGNLAAGESLTRDHSFTKTIEDYSEEEITTTKSEQRDLTVSERFSVQNEISNNLKMSADLHAEYSGTTGSGSYKLTADASVSKETAQKEAREQFRESVEKAVTSLQVETRKLTTRRVTTVETENNSHAFVNDTPNHSVAKYFYVSKEVEGQVFSHGLRMTVDLRIPTPAALYEHLEKVKFDRAFGRTKPVAPGIAWQELDPKKHFEYVVGYGLEGMKPPPKQPEEIWKDEIKPVGEPNSTKTLANIDQFTISIPSGYSLTYIQFASDPAIDWNNDKQGGNLAFNTPSHGAIWFGYSHDGNSYDRSHMGKAVSYRNTVNIVVSGTNLKSYQSQLLYRLTPDPVDYTEWKIAIYQAIMEKYEASLAQYEEDLAAFKRQYDASKFGRHPFTNKEIILAEMKRAAIYMMCEDFERGDIMAMNTPPCGFPEYNRKTAFEESADWYFWETCFDWRLMSFIFYDYFWNSKCDWPEKFAPGHDDFMFNSFLRAGFARTVFPVRPGMEADVIFYLETGQKWGLTGQAPMNPSDPRWISVVQELKQQRDCFQNDREGMVSGFIDAAASTTPGTIMLTDTVLLKGSDRYWDPIGQTLNQAAIDNDVGREIYIDGLQYRIVAITPSTDPMAPVYDPAAPGQTMWWNIKLERRFAFDGQNDLSLTSILPDFPYAVGAAYVGAPFRWQEPTNLVWLSDAGNNCLPTYPVQC